MRGKRVSANSADRWAVESYLGTACHGPVALGEYLHALQEEVGDRPAGEAAGSEDPAAWDALLRDGLPALPEKTIQIDTREEINRVAWVCPKTAADIWKTK